MSSRSYWLGGAAAIVGGFAVNMMEAPNSEEDALQAIRVGTAEEVLKIHAAAHEALGKIARDKATQVAGNEEIIRRLRAALEGEKIVLESESGSQ